MWFRKLAALGALLVALSFGGAEHAEAQSNPGWPSGYTPTAAQWASAFSGKQDYLGAAPLITIKNLFDLTNVATARSNLGLSSLVTLNATQLTAALNPFTASLQGMVPASVSSDGNHFLNSGGTFTNIPVNALQANTITIGNTSITLGNNAAIFQGLALLGVGSATATSTTPINVLTVQNGPTEIEVANTATGAGGTAATATFLASTGLGSGTLEALGTSYTTSGILVASDMALVSAQSMDLASGGAIKFAVDGSTTQVAQFNTSGLLTLDDGLTMSSSTITGSDSGTWDSGGINGSAIGGTTPEAGKFTSVGINATPTEQLLVNPDIAGSSEWTASINGFNNSLNGMVIAAGSSTQSVLELKNFSNTLVVLNAEASGAITFAGPLNGITNIDMSGGLALTGTAATEANSIVAAGTTTAANYWTISNTSGAINMGVESSVGGTLIVGDGAYDAIIATNNEALDFSAISSAGIGFQLNASNRFIYTNVEAVTPGTAGAACFNTGKELGTDTANCIASLAFLKNIHGEIPIWDAIKDTWRLLAIWYDLKADPSHRTQPGFTAEQVSSVDGRLAERDVDGTLRGVLYEQMSAIFVQDFKAIFAAMLLLFAWTGAISYRMLRRSTIARVPT